MIVFLIGKYADMADATDTRSDSSENPMSEEMPALKYVTRNCIKDTSMRGSPSCL